jgi:hypothetical protein
MEAQTLIEQAIARYRCINQVSLEIEQAIVKNDRGNVTALCVQLNHLQTEAKTDDSALVAVLQERRELGESAAFKEWLGLMQAIQARNQRLLLHLSSIMAVRRNELRTLHQGATVLQGYHPGSIQTGKRVSFSG